MAPGFELQSGGSAGSAPTSFSQSALTVGGSIEVERAPAGTTAFARIATLPADATSYSDSGLPVASTFAYRLRAAAGGLFSGYSNVASATTWLLTAIPQAPTSLTANAIGPTQVHLTWQDASANEDGFRIERSINGAAFQVLRDVGANSVLGDDPQLTPNTDYAYRVRAFNSVGVSNYAGPATARPTTSVASGFTVTVPVSSANGTYDVTLSYQGALASGSLFIEESLSSTFLPAPTTTTKTFTTIAWPLVWPRTAKTSGTWYYRGGTAALRSTAKSVVVAASGPVTATVYAQYDNSVAYWLGYSGAEGTYGSSTGSLVIGNSFEYYPQMDLSTGDITLFTSSTLNRTLLMFDLSSLIGHAAITKATLRLYPGAIAPDRDTLYNVGAMNDNWYPSTVTWGSAPSCYASGVVAVDPPISTALPLEFVVTAIVQKWVTRAWDNCGFKLWDGNYQWPGDTTNRITWFESVDYYTSLSRRPQLVLEYTPQ